MSKKSHKRTIALSAAIVMASSVSATSIAAGLPSIPGVQQSPRGEDWQDTADDALTLEEKRQLHEEQAKRQREREEAAYKKRLKDLGILPDSKSGGSSSSGSSQSSSGDSSGDSSGESSDAGSSDSSGLPASSEGFAEPMLDSIENISSQYKTPDRPGHLGIDIAKPNGEAIYSIADGVVVESGPATGFGNWIVIDHQIDGKLYSSVYGHMYDDGLHVNVGDEVTAGQHIADEGSNGQSTGPHLHFEIWDGGRITGGSEVNPTPWVERARS